MLAHYEIPIIICEEDKIITIKTKKLLNAKGFSNILLYNDTKELIDNIEIINEKVGTVLILGFSNEYSIPILETAQTIKTMCSNVMIIGSGINSTNKFSTAIIAIQNGCDSWVEKNRKGYSADLLNRVDIWTKYISEKSKLDDYYIIGGL